MIINYMGIFVEDENIQKHCSNCKFELETDRLECNHCSREWNNSNYIKFVGWKPKTNVIQ